MTPGSPAGRQGLGVAHAAPRCAMTAALPVSVTPRPGESIESWLEHLADANGLTTAQLLTATGRAAGTLPDPGAVTGDNYPARCSRPRRRGQLYAATLAAFDLTGLDPDDRHLPSGGRSRLDTRPRHPDLRDMSG